MIFGFPSSNYAQSQKFLLQPLNLNPTMAVFKTEAYSPKKSVKIWLETSYFSRKIIKAYDENNNEICKTT